MMLRRVMQHVRDQNWFAVGVDFVIVVVGVFIGIQVANWNEERQLAAQERSYLSQLRDLAALDTAAMLRAMHADPVLRQQLRFWLGQNILAEVAYPGMRMLGEAALAAVSAELGMPEQAKVQ